MKENCFIQLNGCDDSTLINIQLNKEEIKLLELISNKSNEISTYGCMPTLRLIKDTEARKLEDEIFDSLMNE